MEIAEQKSFYLSIYCLLAFFAFFYFLLREGKFLMVYMILMTFVVLIISRLRFSISSRLRNVLIKVFCLTKSLIDMMNNVFN